MAEVVGLGRCWDGDGRTEGDQEQRKNTHTVKEDGPERRTAGLPAVRWHEWLAYPGGGCR